MELRPAQDDDVPAIVALCLANDDARVLSAEGFRFNRSTRRAEERVLELVAEEDGDVIGWGIGGANVFTSTPGAVWGFVTAAAAHRRAGIGSALAARVLDHFAALGGTKATSFMRQTEEGERWALAHGWSRAISGPLIALDPRRVPPPEPPAGYQCVSVAELALEDVYAAMCEAMLDEPTPVPNDNFSLEDFRRESDDPDMDIEASAAVVTDEGTVAAFAYIKTAGDRAQHGFTGTARAHRGRGLATAAKRHALQAAAAKGVTRVTTSNAEENVAMRAINRRLGFQPVGEHVILARDL